MVRETGPRHLSIVPPNRESFSGERKGPPEPRTLIFLNQERKKRKEADTKKALEERDEAGTKMQTNVNSLLMRLPSDQARAMWALYRLEEDADVAKELNITEEQLESVRRKAVENLNKNQGIEPDS